MRIFFSFVSLKWTGKLIGTSSPTEWRDFIHTSQGGEEEEVDDNNWLSFFKLNFNISLIIIRSSSSASANAIVHSLYSTPVLDPHLQLLLLLLLWHGTSRRGYRQFINHNHHQRQQQWQWQHQPPNTFTYLIHWWILKLWPLVLLGT